MRKTKRTGHAKQKWYVAHEILYFEPKHRPQQRGADALTVWENLILTRAKNAEEAYRRSLWRGRMNEQEVRIDGSEGRCRFAGLRDLFLIYDELEDGAELEWRRFAADDKKISGLVRGKRQMQAFSVEENRVGRRRRATHKDSE